MCMLCIAIKEKAHCRIDMQSLWVCLRIEKLLVFRHALRRISTGCFTIDYHFSNLNRPKSQFCKKKLQGQALCFLPPRDKKKNRHLTLIFGHNKSLWNDWKKRNWFFCSKQWKVLGFILTKATIVQKLFLL